MGVIVPWGGVSPLAVFGENQGGRAWEGGAERGSA
jgi:hypothetical protein